MASRPTVDVSAKSAADMRDWHLFIVPGETNSQKAVSASRLLSETVYQIDIRKLPTLPTFVRGVPTLYQKKEGQVLQGTSCLIKLDEMSRSETIPSVHMTGLKSFRDARDIVSTRKPGVNSFEGGATTPAPVTSTEKITDDDVQRYMEMRAAGNRAAVDRIQNKNQIPIGTDRMPVEVAQKVLAQ